MRILVVGMFVLGIGCKPGDSASIDDSSEARPAPAKAAKKRPSKDGAARLKQPGVSLSKLLASPETKLATLLGKPDSDGHYKVQGVTFSVDYFNGVPQRLIIHGKGVRSRELLEWLGASLGELDVGPRKYLVLDAGTDDGALLSINDMTLPKKKLQLARSLGKKRPAVLAQLGKPSNEAAGMDVFNPWAPDERCGVIVSYTPASQVQSVEVSCNDGINPSERRAEVLRWLGIPDRAQVQGYNLTVSKIAVTLRR